MNEDAEVSQKNNNIEELSSVSTLRMEIARAVYTEESLARRLQPRTQAKNNNNTFKAIIRTKLKNFKCSPKMILLSLFPITRWLPKYSLKRDLAADFTGGLTVGIFHVPQGLAFAMLASLPPVTGLYVALVPVIVYMLMGTSRHISQGSFALICLMVATVVNREVKESIDTGNSSASVDLEPTLNINYTHTYGSVLEPAPWSPFVMRKMEVAVTLTLVVGIIQVLMGVARLGFLASCLSDPLISGFTTGTAVIVVITQVKLILQVPVPNQSGLFAALKTIFLMLKHIPDVNVGSLITGVFCLAIILCIKHINEKFKKRLRLPIPAELIAVILGTAIGYGGELKKNFHVSTLGNVPKGLPPVSVPKFNLVPSLFIDAFVIAVVIFATNITMSKMFAKKNSYCIDANQELIAYGAANISGAFFSCFAVCHALARSVLQESLAKTQLCSVVVVILVMFVLSFVAPLFSDLPKAILAAVVIANLVGLLKQFSQLLTLWRICRSDAIIWVCSCAGVILLGIDLGLAFGVAASLLSVFLQLSRPYVSLLGQVPKSEIYRDTYEFEQSVDEPQGIKIFKFESSLYFANVEHFRNTLVGTIGLDPNKLVTGKEEIAVDEKAISENICDRDSRTVETKLLLKECNNTIHTIILDGTSFTFVDSMGIRTLITLIKEYRRIGLNVYLAGCSYNMRRRLLHGGFHDAVGTKCMFVTVHDAVLHAALIHKTQSGKAPITKHNWFSDFGDVNDGSFAFKIPPQAWLDSPETHI